MQIFDLTHTINENMPVYPGTMPPKFEAASTYENDGFKETLVSFYTHTGTHIDPPAHLFKDKKTLDEFPITQFFGRAIVIDCRKLKDGEAITMEQLEPYKEKIYDVDFLLFCLGYDKYWGSDKYFGDYPCLDDNVMNFIIDGNYKGIGFDVIGLDPISDETLKRHNKLFSSKDIINIENLKDLDKLGNEPFMFACLPMKLEKSDGCSARAIAWIE